MHFHVQLKHSPALCWARTEHEGKASELVKRFDNAAEEFGVTIHSAHLAPNEHTFFLLVETEHYENLVALLGPPLLHDHDAEITPVTTFGQALDATGVE